VVINLLSSEPVRGGVNLQLSKQDKDTGEPWAQGGGSLAGAVFEISWYDPGSPDAISGWVTKTVTTTLNIYTGDVEAIYPENPSQPKIPIGNVWIREVTAPEGYLIAPAFVGTNSPNSGYMITVPDSGDPASVDISLAAAVPFIDEEVKRGDISLSKSAETTTGAEEVRPPLEGIQFQIINSNESSVVVGGITYAAGEIVGTLTTDEHGFASTAPLRLSGQDGALPFGDYIIHEVAATVPSGLIQIADISARVEVDGHTYHYILQDNKIRQPISVIKLDATTGAVIPRSGTTFQILDSALTKISMTWIEGGKRITRDSFTTDDSGEYLLPEMLSAGRYYVQETIAPTGYLLNDSLIAFDVTSRTEWDDPIIVELYDTPAMGRINVTKLDSETATELAGAVFEVSADTTITTPDGTLRAAAGDVVDLITTDIDGTAQTHDLFLGDYSIVETVSPSGYLFDETTHTVSLEYADQYTQIVYGELEIENQPNEMQLLKIKKGTYTPLPGVTYRLWDSIEGTDSAITYTTDTDGRISIKRLAAGVWCSQEVTTIPGYVLDSTITTFTVDAHGYIDNEPIKCMTLTNDFTKVDISKTDITNGKELPGATLTIKDSTGTVICRWTSTDRPKRFETLPPGNYTLSEDAAPVGYVVADSVTFTVTETGVIKTVKMVDDIIQLQVLKVSNKTGDTLSGAHLQLLDPKDRKVLYDWTSTNLPKLFQRIPAGTYVIHEVCAPVGHKVGQDQTVTVLSKPGIQTFIFGNDEIPLKPLVVKALPIKPVKVGDSTNLWWIVAIIAASIITLIILQTKRRKVTPQ
jgi:uncharacterized surface anchored protein